MGPDKSENPERFSGPATQKLRILEKGEQAEHRVTGGKRGNETRSELNDTVDYLEHENTCCGVDEMDKGSQEAES